MTSLDSAAPQDSAQTTASSFQATVNTPATLGVATASPDQLGNVLVLGLGGSGEAVARYCLERLHTRVSSVTVVDGREGKPEVVARLEAAGARVLTGVRGVAETFDLAVVSPGIPHHTPLYESACACASEVIGEPEFAWRESPARWLAITGTNGKTTTTSLTTHLLNSANIPARAVGNIGTVVTSALDERGVNEWYVAELSSFQLAGTRMLHPVAAAILNVTPDHLSWHGSLAEYAAAKERIFDNLTAHDLAVVNMDDETCLKMAVRLECRDVRVCELSCERIPTAPCAAFRRDGVLVVRLDGEEHELAREDELLIEGAHNLQNALAASALALAAGADPVVVAQALTTFEPLEHRIEPCGVIAGVRYVNDSKATDTDAVEKAVAAFEPGKVILLAGGHDKGTELEEFTARVVPACKAVVCFGDAGDRFSAAFAAAAADADSGTQVLRVAHLADALATGAQLAERGDVVLLSPACSSFDEFSGFEERGRVFKALVEQLAAQLPAEDDVEGVAEPQPQAQVEACEQPEAQAEVQTASATQAQPELQERS